MVAGRWYGVGGYLIADSRLFALTRPCMAFYMFRRIGCRFYGLGACGVSHGLLCRFTDFVVL